MPARPLTEDSHCEETMKSNSYPFYAWLLLLHVLQICLIFYSIHLRLISGTSDYQFEKIGNLIMTFQYAGLITYIFKKGYSFKIRPPTWFLVIYSLVFAISCIILGYSIYLRSA